MIKLFRNIRKKLLEQGLPAGQAGKVRNYFFYAIGEIILVAIIQKFNQNLKTLTYRSPLGRG